MNSWLSMLAGQVNFVTYINILCFIKYSLTIQNFSLKNLKNAAIFDKVEVFSFLNSRNKLYA